MVGFLTQQGIGLVPAIYTKRTSQEGVDGLPTKAREKIKTISCGEREGNIKLTLVRAAS